MKRLSVRPRSSRARMLALMLSLAALAGLGVLATAGAAPSAPTVVTISFDDGLSDQYQVLPWFQQHGLHATFYVNSAELGTSGYYMTMAQAHDLAAAGNEIGGHTLHHPDLTTLTTAQATTEICDDRTALVNQGFTVTDFAYPYGHTNAAIEQIAQNCGYSSARGVSGIVSPDGCTFNATSCPYAETLPAADPYLTRTPENAESTTTLATLEGYVTQAEQHGGGYVQIVIHHICAGSDCDIYSTTPATMQGLLAWLAPRAANGTVVRTTAQALQGVSSDTTAPTVSLTAPADGSTVSGTVSLAASASDNVGVSKVEFYRGGTLIGTTASSPYTASWDTSAVPNGSYTVSAEAYDAAGNATTSSRTVTVQNAVQQQRTIVSLGFDDGDADQYSVRSMLASHGMNATFYINSGRINAANYMTVGQIQALQSDGNEIAGHTVTHADLPTLDVAEQTRQICNDRVALLADGFPVRSFAYPYGDFNAQTEGIAQSCGYANARTIGGLVTPTSCSGCGYASAVPPVDPYQIPTPDSIKSDMSLAQIEGYVTAAEQHGGGLVPIVMHHVQDDCGTDEYCVTPATLGAFLDWLQPRAAHGTVVQEIGDVIGGPVKPGVAGPPAPPPAAGANLLQNPSLEADANNDLTPDCWQLGGYGNNTATWTRSSDAEDGSFGEQLTMSTFSDGDRRLITRQDLGACSPTVTPGHTYNISAWYKTTGNSRIVVYTRNAAGTWVFFAQQAAALPNTSVWTKTTFTTPAVPAGTTALSIGISLRAVGTLSMDNFSLGDTDQTPPTVALTAPADGSTVSGSSVPLTADAADASGIARVDFIVNGNVVASSTTPPFSYSWNSLTIDGTASIAARAVDTAGNSTISASSLVTVANGQADTTPPVSSVTCGGLSCAGWHAAGTLVALSATDAGSGVSQIVYTTDGSTPTLTNGTWYSAPFPLSTTSTLNFRAYDVAGNSEGVNSVPVSIDDVAPGESISCGGAACDGTWRSLPVTVALSATDSGSGVDRIVYTLDGSIPTASNGTVYVAPFSVFSTAALHFRAIDLVGNMSDVAEAAVRIDTVAPATTATCGGGACGTGWSTGPVSVTLAATDDASGVAKTVYTLDGSNPTAASAVASGPIQVSTTTQLEFRSYDLAGNAEPVNAISILIDGTPPGSSATCNGVPCSASATYSSPLNVALGATDAGSGVAQILYTTDGSIPTPASGTVYTGPFALADTTTVTYRAYDLAGNAEAPNSIALNVRTTPTDTAPPATTASCSDGACATWHSGPLTVTLAATDDASGVAETVYTTDGSDPTTTHGTVYSGSIAVGSTTTLEFRSYDNSGNAEPVQSLNVQVDGTAPVVTATCATACPTGWSTTPLTVTLKATDAGSGVSTIVYTLDGSSPTLTNGSTYSGPFVVGATATVKYRAYDQAGNASAISSLPLKVDVTAPTASATCNGTSCAAAWYPSPTTVALTASDAGSGIASVRYTTNGTDPTTTNGTTYTHTLSITSTTNLRFRSYDTAGNAGAVTRLTVSIDSSLPVTKVNCNGTTCPTGWVTGAQNVVLSATDTGSGVARIVYTANGTTPTATNGQTYTGTIVVSTSTTVAFIAIDGAGNASAVKSVALKIDTTAPTVTITAPVAGGVTGTSVHVTGTATDNATVSSVTWYLDGRVQSSTSASSFDFTWNTRNAARGVHTIYVQAKDQAGNVGQSASRTVTVS